jgi:hypothetical protein
MIMIPMTGGIVLLAVLYCGFLIVRSMAKGVTENGGMSVVLREFVCPCVFLISFILVICVFRGLGIGLDWVAAHPYKFAIALCSLGAFVIIGIWIFKDTIYKVLGDAGFWGLTR